MSIKRLVADVGGTNTRIGLFDETHGKLERVVGYRNRDFAGLEDIVAAWLEELPCAAPSRACIAVAAPPSGDEVRMVNIGWSFSRRALAQRFGLEQLLWINDFQANAYALPFLDGAGLEPLNVGNPGDHRTLATVGPGTGLGGATLHWIEGRPVVGDGEPGHAGLSPANELELEIFRLLLPEYGDI